MTVTPIKPGALYLVRLRAGDRAFTREVEASHPIEAALYIASLIYAETGATFVALEFETDPTIN